MMMMMLMMMMMMMMMRVMMRGDDVHSYVNDIQVSLYIHTYIGQTIQE